MIMWPFSRKATRREAEKRHLENMAREVEKKRDAALDRLLSALECATDRADHAAESLAGKSKAPKNGRA